MLAVLRIFLWDSNFYGPVLGKLAKSADLLNINIYSSTKEYRSNDKYINIYIYIYIDG